MKRILLNLLVLFAAIALPLCAWSQTVAFPGAEGYGRMTTGGRGGTVYHVTTLEDNTQSGSFRYACTRSGKRTIVFDVSGTIYLTSELKLKNGDVTIAGQTAPGDGICIADYPFVIASSNVIIRYMRFRLGNRQVAHHEGDGLGGMDQRNIMVDHCSVSWSIDECLSVYGSHDFTVQWCIAAQSLKNAGHSKGAHGYGGNWGGSGASYHHNLIIHNESRTPRFGPRQSTQMDERMDYRNNVIYNWAGNGCYGGEGMNVNVVNNYYKPGPATLKRSSSIQQRIHAPSIRTVDYCLDKTKTAANFKSATGTAATVNKGSRANGVNYVDINGTKYAIDMTNSTISVNGTTVTVAWNGWKPMLHTWGKFYCKGNVNSRHSQVAGDNFKYGISNQIDKTGNDGTYPGDNALKLAAPIEFLATTTHTAEKAFDKVLDYVGASHKRDALDEILISDAKNGTATFTASGNLAGIINNQDDITYSDGTHGWPNLQSETAPQDTDKDGIPDAWEDANGLDKNNAADGKTVTTDGYTNLEHYLNSLVADITEEEAKDGVVLSGTQEFDPSMVTGISSVTQDRQASHKIYNAQGIEVAKATVKGVYIKGGRKYIVK